MNPGFNIIKQSVEV